MNCWIARFASMLFCVATTTVTAHHSYAMFDKRKSLVIEGSIAKVEWVNPHAFVWVYVKKPNKPGEYDLFGFETATPNQLKLNGWTKDSVKAGEKVSIRYFPLRDGRAGGYLIWLRRGDGIVLTSDKDAFGVAAELQRLEKEKAASPAAPKPENDK
jgi:hypothetical protein